MGTVSPRRLTDSASVVLFGLACTQQTGIIVQQVVIDGDDVLFGQIQTNEHHIPRELLPNTMHRPTIWTPPQNA